MSGYEVVGDWGTSHLRLFRIEQGRPVARLSGPGIAAAGARAEAAFAETIAPWLEDGMPDQIRLCGMAGARDGWVEALYVDCPTTERDWRSAAARFDWRGVPVSILAGLACTDGDGVADVMRGEETQLFGAIKQHPELAEGRQLIILPGTHNKWTQVEDGRIIAFRTVPTGELYALLRRHLQEADPLPHVEALVHPLAPFAVVDGEHRPGALFPGESSQERRRGLADRIG